MVHKTGHPGVLEKIRSRHLATPLIAAAHALDKMRFAVL